jgi:hypothetical protein
MNANERQCGKSARLTSPSVIRIHSRPFAVLHLLSDTRLGGYASGFDRRSISFRLWLSATWIAAESSAPVNGFKR